MIRRMIILAGCFLLSAVLIASASKTEKVPPRESLATFPMTIGTWNGHTLPDFAPEILDVLGVDEYVNRIYESKGGVASLYIGYYESQRQGDTIYSPLNCLPGSGLEPISKSYVSIPVETRRLASTNIMVNQYSIQQGLDR